MITLPTKPEDLEILKTGVKALAGLFAQEDSVKEGIKVRAASCAEAIEMKPADIKKLGKALFLSNATELREQAEA